jgi:hypothetical protein
MPWDRFLAFNAAGAMAWATLMGTLAYVFGQTVLQLGTSVGIASGAAGLLLMAGLTVALQRSERRWQQEVDLLESSKVMRIGAESERPAPQSRGSERAAERGQVTCQDALQRAA